jgi:hypothetical protein
MLIKMSAVFASTAPPNLKFRTEVCLNKLGGASKQKLKGYQIRIFYMLHTIKAIN